MSAGPTGSTPAGGEQRESGPEHQVPEVEITSPGSVAADRAVKPDLYARAGIRHYLHIAPWAAEPTATAFRLDDGSYTAVACSTPGELLQLAEPFPVALDLNELADTVRPDDLR